jgi:asparagine synthase (glutamine-hydrolysing)
MVTDDGRYAIVYNGEVYNFREVRQTLEALGERFGSGSDTEVILRAYARWGSGCLDRFRGMFAFAIWDGKEASIFLARDRLGIKPLYYTAVPGGLAFASEVRALLATETARRKLSIEALASYFTFGSVSDPLTIVEGVASLPPGCCLEYRNGRQLIRRYWSLPLPEADGSMSPADAAERVRPRLAEAVSLRLIADVPVGVFLSAGIDSTALATLAARASTSPVQAFTVSFDERQFDEGPIAAATAAEIGCEHQLVRLPASRALAEMDQVVAALDQPSVDGINAYFISKAVREAGLKVALSGQGGDEIFGGYSYFRTFRTLSALRPPFGGPASRVLRHLLAHGPASIPWRYRKAAAILAAAGQPLATYRSLRGIYAFRHQRALLPPEIAETAVRVLPCPVSAGASRVDVLNLYSALELSNYLRNTLLRDCDVMSMAHGLEVRVPFLDHLLVEELARIPGRLKVRRGGPNKPLLVESVGGLRASVTGRRKTGFTLPFDEWFKGPLKPWIERLLLGDCARALPLRRDGVAALWHAFSQQGGESYARVWGIAALSAWCELHGVDAG